MFTPKWFAIAKAEYTVRINNIRAIKPFFPYLTAIFLTVYIIYIAPFLANLFIDDFLAMILSYVAIAMIQVILFMLFLNFILVPICLTMKDVQTQQTENILAAPIDPSDVLLGEFLGKLPFITIIIVLITGFFTAILGQLGLDLIQIAVINVVFAIVILSAYWIGTVIAIVLRTVLKKYSYGKDIGKGLAILVVMPSIALIYAVQGGAFLQTLTDPETSGIMEVVLSLFPSSWGAEIIVNFALNPGNIIAGWFETVIRLGRLFVFIILSLYLGVEVINHFYNIEPSTFTSNRAKHDGLFIKSIKQVGGGGSFGILLAVIFKDYIRRFENISKIVYFLGILILVNIFVDYKIYIIGIVLSLTILVIIAMNVEAETTLRGKNNLLLYKRAPKGIEKLVKARLLQGWLVVIPIAIISGVILAILSPQATFEDKMAGSIILMLPIVASVILGLGTVLINPAYSDKDGNFLLNIMIVPLVIIACLFTALIVFDNVLMFIPIVWFVAIVTLLLGIWRFSRLE